MSKTALLLREATAESHRQAEKHPLNRALARGEIPDRVAHVPPPSTASPP